jgi:UDP-N-acetylmuramyl pentapeptide phosphotransferase/UDP-N-acetylglucosamine-1-phosphate transferase
MLYVFLGTIVAFLVGILMPHLIEYLERQSLFDIPNERSSHVKPTPRGGGWLVLGLPIMLLFLTSFFLSLPPDVLNSLYALVAALFIVMIVSGADDRYTLGTRIRLLIHLMVAILVVYTLPDAVRVLPLLPDIIENIILILGLVWMMNLTNFMDGINGITAVNGINTAIGLALFSLIYGLPVPSILSSLLLGGLTGFIVWNWGNAKIFMGDVGSIPLGLWLGYGLIFVADQVGIIPALLLALYPILDATITLVKRAWQRKPIWQAHKEHFYQQAVQNGRTHARTSTFIAAYNLLCLLLFLAVLYVPHTEWVLLGVALLGFYRLVTLFARKPRDAA